MNFATSLLQLLSRQLDAYTRFLELLHTEQTALEQPQADALENCTVARLGLVITLEEQDREIRTLLISAKINFSSRAVQQWCAGLAEPQRSQLAQLWQQLLIVVAECQKQNDINSKIVDTRRQYTARVLRILTGQTPLAGTTYTADGRVQPGTASATLATA